MRSVLLCACAVLLVGCATPRPASSTKSKVKKAKPAVEEAPPPAPAPAPVETTKAPEPAPEPPKPAADPRDVARPVRLLKELSTLHCLGYRWLIDGDANGDATVEVSFRKEGAPEWHRALPLRRIEMEALLKLRPKDADGMFAGSIMFLDPNTAYDVKLELKDPDGPGATERFVHRTWAEPKALPASRTLYVTPGSGGGSGTKGDPLRGLAAAASAVRAGDHVLLGAGTYTPPLSIKRNGTAAAPIVWRAAGDGDVVVKGADKGVGVTAYGKKHHFFEGLTFRDLRYGFHMNGSSDMTVRRCRFENVGTCVFGDGKGQEHIFVADCHMRGPEPWPKPKGHKSKAEHRAVELCGEGHVICYNSVHRYRDAIDVRGPHPVRAVDIHNNEIGESTDDGIELDFSDSNTRAFLNRITDVPLGISFQPIHGGPSYAVRNVLYNVGHESFKLHVTRPAKHTSGGVILHNTIIKDGPPFRVWSNEGPAHYFVIKNNLFVSSQSGKCVDITIHMKDADLDYNAYVSGATPFSRFGYWEKKKYATFEDFVKGSGQEAHGVSAAGWDGVFAREIEKPKRDGDYEPVDARPAPGSPVVDKAQPLPGINDGYAGAAPDIGAYELGDELPRYGPRP